MKTINLGRGLVFAVVALLASCSKNDTASNTITPTTVSTTVSSGTWKVTYFWNADHEETNNFTGYTFSFSGNGVVTSVRTSSVVTGSWSTGMDDSKVKLVLVFTIPSNFENLSEDWQVLEKTDSHIKLQHLSGGNGGADYLTFDKN